MSDPIRNKLGAYLDGELDRRTQSEVRAHLQTCPACQAELEELSQLSRLLRAAPLPELTPAVDFKDRLILQLPRRAEAQPARPGWQILPWLAPVVVLAGWIFIQVTLSLSNLVSLAGKAGILDGAAAWAGGSPQQMDWFTAVQAVVGGLLGPQGVAVLKTFNDAGLIAQNLTVPLLWQAGAALLYWGLLTLLWHNKVKEF